MTTLTHSPTVTFTPIPQRPNGIVKDIHDYIAINIDGKPAIRFLYHFFEVHHNFHCLPPSAQRIVMVDYWIDQLYRAHVKRPTRSYIKSSALSDDDVMTFMNEFVLPVIISHDLPLVGEYRTGGP